MKIKVREGMEIGDGCPPFIVAEIGSNWRNFDDCLHSIAMAKNCGADAVKFQAFDRDSLYGLGNLTAHLPDGYTTPFRSLGELRLEWIPKLKTHSDAIGIEFMCSAFSPELVRAVDPYVNLHKVASAELTHVRILEALRAIGKPVILSTGASGQEDIRRALATLEGVPIVLLYCVSAYPARQIDLPRMMYLNRYFHVLVGFSDHSTDVLTIPDAAIAAGACVLEKHVTFIEAETPDSPHSLNLDEFKTMVRRIRSLDAGTGSIGPTREELPMILRHNRRLIATKDIAAGEFLREDVNFGIYRSLKDDTHAFSPWVIDEVNGRESKRAIKAGDGIGPGDV